MTQISRLVVDIAATDSILDHPIMNTLSPPRRQPSERKTSGVRARDLLRQHYGLSGLPIPAPSGLPNDPLDIGQDDGQQSRCSLLMATTDSPAFDAQGYFNQLVTTSSLPTLLKRENELSEGSQFIMYPGRVLNI